MKYMIIEHFGNEGYVDKMIEIGGFVYMFSMFGNSDIIKSLSSSFLSYQCLNIKKDKEEFDISRLSSQKYIMYHKKIKHGISHCLIFTPDLLSVESIGDTVVIIEPNPEKFYDILYKKYPTPLLPEWREDLYRDFVTDSSEAVWLNSFGYKSAVKIHLPTQQVLEDHIVNMLRDKKFHNLSIVN